MDFLVVNYILIVFGVYQVAPQWLTPGQQPAQPEQINCGNELMAQKFAEIYGEGIAGDVAELQISNWKYVTNITEENRKAYQDARRAIIKRDDFRRPQLAVFDSTVFTDELLKRQFASFSSIDEMPADRRSQLSTVVGKMSANYGKVRICAYKNREDCSLQLDPELTEILKTSDDPDELAYYWKEWYDKAGTSAHSLYKEYLQLKNEDALRNYGVDSMADVWTRRYSPKFEEDLETIVDQLRPIFMELHGFVRHALVKKYGENVVKPTGPIPAHLVGNVWGQMWANIERISVPFPDDLLSNATDEMIRQNWTPKRMYEVAENFYVSLGLPKMTDQFWENSIIEKPVGREIICHPNAWDMSNGSDFRIKHCSRVNLQDLNIIHHEMGHIEYFMMYRHQPFIFRSAPNDGIHEALGDVIALSANSIKYLQQIGLMSDGPVGMGQKLNLLYRMALEKLPPLHYSIALETHRYGMFRNQFGDGQENCAFWQYMQRILGVQPAVTRHSDDFDPPAKYHISADVEYARYVVSTVIQFSIHKKLCMEAGEYDPIIKPDVLLAECSLFGSDRAGDILREAMSLGSSVGWPQVLYMLTGSPELDTTGILEYFQPLYAVLVDLNRENGACTGWDVNEGACVAKVVDPSIVEEEIRAQKFLDELNREMIRHKNIDVQAEWNYDTNITVLNAQKKEAAAAAFAEFSKNKALEISKYRYDMFKNEDLKRQFKLMAKLGNKALPTEKLKELTGAVSSMESNYAKVRVCSYEDRTKCDLQLEPELTEVLMRSDDPEELKYYWTEWYDKAGTAVRPFFDKYVELNKEAAILNNFTSGAEMWLEEYEDPTFEQQLESIFEEIRPLYQQLHAYARHALRAKYGDVVSETGPIPMHLLGNMWGQSWDSVAQYTMPFPGKTSTDVTEEMLRQNYTAVKMFQMSDEFFQSLNFTALPESFWELSILEKPTDGRDLVCHASASDFYSGTDVRIKQCSRINPHDFKTAHHEMGHVQYSLQYAHQPFAFREGANPGFHEAVGDVIALSVSTPKHLEKIGLLQNYTHDEEAKINALYTTALSKIAFLPFAYTLDQYRWAIFRGQVKPDEYNCRFWQMREKASGLKPPVQRYKEDFDPPAKYHISADVEYLRYVVSFLIQFQFHKGACIKAGEYEPGNPQKLLSDCNIYQSKAAGNALKEMLALGRSKPWPDAMETLTGEREMGASALLEYFKPLQDWLEKKNQETGAHIGWDAEFKCLSKNDV